MLPSSVVHYPNGLSVQVANTDGEGRLIIADALHAPNLGADKVIDIATLTGNVGAALGLEIAGIWGDPQITADLVEIGERNGERVWPMPLMDEYESELRSDYSDLKNVGTSTLAGAITVRCLSVILWRIPWNGCTSIWRARSSINGNSLIPRRVLPDTARDCSRIMWRSSFPMHKESTSIRSDDDVA